MELINAKRFTNKICSDAKAIPFLKWAGGKQWLSWTLLNLIPLDYKRYYEPFLGAGAFFFTLNPSKAVLGDLNERLIETFVAIKKCPHQVIKQLSQWKYNKKLFYEIRATHYRSRSARAAQFIYLNRTCWNGLYRVNQKGNFNVPFGNFSKPLICNQEVIIAANRCLKNVQLNVGDFQNTVGSASKNDLVYFDPPYTVMHANNGFVKYNDHIFSWKDQCRLAEVAAVLRKKGCYVIVSNAYHDSISKLYRNFFQYPIARKSVLAADPKNRKNVLELVLTSFPIKLANRVGGGR